MSQNVNIEARKVQKFGRSTLMVSLPADWVRDVGLKPGDTVTIVVDENKALRIYPAFTAPEVKERRILIKISKSTRDVLIEKVMTAAYELAYDVITVEVADGYIEEDQLKIVRTLVKDLIGAEIIEHYPNKISIQVFVDPTKHSINGIIARMSNIVMYMMQYLFYVINERKRHFLDEIKELKLELERLYRLSIRQTFISSEHLYQRQDEIKPHMIPRFRTVARSLNIIGSSISNISNMIGRLSDEDLSKLANAGTDLRELFDVFKVALEKAINAVEKASLIDSFNAVMMSNELNEYVVRYLRNLYKDKGETPQYVLIREIVDSIRRSSTDIAVIAGIGIDLAIERSEGVVDLASEEILKII